MIDEARFIAAAAAIDDATIIQTEKVSVIERAFGIGSVLCDFPHDAFALIFNDAYTRLYRAARENTGAVDGGSFDDVERWRCCDDINYCIACDWIL